MNMQELIRALGGAVAVGRALGLKPNAVSMWISRGDVSAEHRIAVWRMAVEKGVDWEPPGAAELRASLVASLAPPPPPPAPALAPQDAA